MQKSSLCSKICNIYAYIFILYFENTLFLIIVFVSYLMSNNHTKKGGTARLLFRQSGTAKHLTHRKARTVHAHRT